MNENLTVGFIGNPNCGKTTLFNAFTGANLKVANWPGVTVDKKEGAFRYHNNTYRLVDLPGTYSLSSYTMEEQVARQYILSDEVDVIVDVADASSLERNLYLTLQLLELGKPVVLALNMMDIVEKRGMEIDLHRLPEMLGIPVIPVSARRRTGLGILMHAVSHHKDAVVPDKLVHHHDGESGHVHNHHLDHVMVYSDEIEDKIDIVSEELQKKYPDVQNLRWCSIKLLEQDTELTEKYPLSLPGVLEHSYESEIINQKYDFIEEIVQEVLVNKEEKAERTNKVDKLFTHRILGVPIFLAAMALVFVLTFTLGDWFAGFFEIGIDWLGRCVVELFSQWHVSTVITSLVVDGIIAGVGGILTFLPNIFVLFILLALLEDSGYMARVAYVMDGIMGKIGLSGRAFIPMILGFGCSVPAIMASRALEDAKDRKRTMLVLPFISCSARLPIYILFSQMFFGKYAMLAAYSMYIIGLAVAILVTFVIHVAERKKTTGMLLIELPEYKVPSARTIWIYVWEKVKDYLSRAGTVIFLASIIMWVLLNFGVQGYTTEMTESFGAQIGHLIVPVLVPIGLGYWQIAVALIAGISAKEVVVSSCAVLFGISNVTSPVGMTALQTTLSESGFGMLNAYSLMVFCLLYIPCIATLATIQKESGSRLFTVFAAGFQLVTAWMVSFVIYQVGALF